MAAVECYSLRRVNPFRGVLAVLKTQAGRAYSLDGRHWQIQVLAHAPRGLWANADYGEELQYYRFGLWEASEGLTRVPLNPLLEVGRMVAAAAELARLLPELSEALPFPLAAEQELWLLDSQGAPLALLATAPEGTDAGAVQMEPWQAGERGERVFHSAALGGRGVADHEAGGDYRHLEAVERLVRRTAGTGLNRRWFPAAGGESRPDCPELLVRECWPDEVSQGLMDDYLGWLSPYLLMLPTLSDPTRARLERQASGHALLVESTWRLYPKVLDLDRLRRARVEARLRRAAAA